MRVCAKKCDVYSDISQSRHCNEITVTSFRIVFKNVRGLIFWCLILRLICFMILYPCKYKIMCPFRTEPKPRSVVWAYYGIFLCVLVWCFGQGKSILNDIGSSHETRLLSASNCNELSPMIYKQDHHNIKLLKQVVITSSVIHAKVTKYVATFRYIRVQNGDCMMPTSTVYAIKYAYDFFVLCCHHTMCYK